ncbi:growth hormone-inducible transmembrane protein-like [Macrosteles quadrilineatus]|uniref:growth hormone-inducible transmembrane protein-like n=1 Tax=Macrosteles quadrilineatus TaxID=74068 RepID=UPI0023E22E00|nr:growth hormone-inducible transmembrane protein-like [Macrosteles quadrilineatus]
MLSVARSCRASLPVAKALFNTTVCPTRAPTVNSSVLKNVLWKNFSNEGRDPFTRTARRRRTLKEIAMQPTQGTPFAVGQMAVAGGAVVGIGALCFYGLGLASKPGAIDQAMLWPEYVKDRVRTTYMYLGGSIALTAASAVACFRSPAMIRLMSRNSLLAVAGTFAAMIGTSMVVHNIPYQPGVGAKQLAWAVHVGVMGALIAPMCLLAGPLAIRAAWYTAGVVGGLSAVAVCAPSDKFLTISGPLAIGLGVVLVSSLGSAFLPATSALGAGLYSISLYGGLLLFSGFLLYDTQRIIRAAETHPINAPVPFDPVNASISVYIDTLNIFIRILAILMGNDRKRR